MLHTHAGLVHVWHVLFPHLDQSEQVAAMFGWPFGQDCLPSFHFKPACHAAYQRVLTALSCAHPHLSSCPLLPALVHVMLHFMEEYECFAAVHHLLQRRAWLDQDLREMQASIATLRALCYSHTVSQPYPPTLNA